MKSFTSASTFFLDFLFFFSPFSNSRLVKKKALHLLVDGGLFNHCLQKKKSQKKKKGFTT